MGKRRRRARQPSMWVASADLPRGGGHPFYERLNGVLDEAGFDAFVERQCATFYADGVGRPSLVPGRYVRMLLLGYVEGLDSERAIAWRAVDSLSLRQFLDIALQEASPDHSTVSRTRRRIDLETHQAVFTWVLRRLADAGLVRGQTVGIDATTLEANAALRSIVRRDTGAGYETFLRGLAEASGMSTPTRAELARFDRKRPKKGSNDDWTHPQDPDATITRMKDGRTRLAHKAEHAVDLETGAIIGVTVQDADAGDTKTMVETLMTAAEQVEAVLPAGAGLTEVVGDKGYHSNETLVALAEVGIRSDVSEPDRGRRRRRGARAGHRPRQVPARVARPTWPRRHPVPCHPGPGRVHGADARRRVLDPRQPSRPATARRPHLRRADRGRPRRQARRQGPRRRLAARQRQPEQAGLADRALAGPRAGDRRGQVDRADVRVRSDLMSSTVTDVDEAAPDSRAAPDKLTEVTAATPRRNARAATCSGALSAGSAPGSASPHPLTATPC